MKKILCILTLVGLMVIQVGAQQPYPGTPKPGGLYISSTGNLVGPWEPFMAAAGSQAYSGTPGAVGLYYSSTGDIAGPWYPCTLATCFGGGGGTPGGPNTSVQYNNGGAFGGFGTWNGSTFTIPNAASNGLNFLNANGRVTGSGGAYLNLDGSGAASIVGAGINQNITLTPSGTGVVYVSNGTNTASLQMSGANLYIKDLSGGIYLYAGGTSTLNITSAQVRSNQPFVATTYGTGAASNPMFISSTAPTIASGFGTSPTIPNANGTAAFTINVGTGGTATTGTLTFPAATTGWVVNCQDITTTNATAFITKQIGPGTTTSVTIGDFTTAGAAGAWAGSDVLACTAMAY